jgi:hypothetical protein|tara:strand:- start:43 stop:471 length:429 start_codon:yes stop_codon:yes gene_type:complete
MKQFNTIFILLGIIMMFSCQTNTEKNNSNNGSDVEVKQEVEPEPEPEPKFIIYEGSITVPYYPDMPQAGGVTNTYKLKLSLELDEASLNGPMTSIRETQSGVYTFVEGSILGISFYPTKDYVTIYNADGGEFGTLYQSKYEY